MDKVTFMDRKIQGLFDEDAENSKFYSLLAGVLLARFSEKRQKENENDGG